MKFLFIHAWYVETRAEQALTHFSKKILKFVKIYNYHQQSFYIPFHSNSQNPENNQDDMNKIQILGCNFQLIAVARVQTMSIGKKYSMHINKCHVYSDVQNRVKAFGTTLKIIC